MLCDCLLYDVMVRERGAMRVIFATNSGLVAFPLAGCRAHLHFNLFVLLTRSLCFGSGLSLCMLYGGMDGAY